MIPDFSRDDISVVSHYLGKIFIAFAIAQLFPVFVGLICREFNPVIDFFISIIACLAFGSILLYFSPSSQEINWRQGMTIVASSWFLAMCFSALPLYLSGHYECFLDACFESMSAYATTGLVLVKDLDHMSHAHNIWRHLMCFIGGQGIILVALVFFFRGGDALRIYVGEARDDKILPNSITTARFIWMVSFTYLVICSSMLAIVLLFHGVPFMRSVFHGLCIFMAGWDTAGFAPQSLNMLYYHSPAFELVTIIIILLGATSFGVHYAVWTGKFRELREDFEVKILMFTVFFTYLIVLVGFSGYTYQFVDSFSFFRTTFYQIISAHTGAGYTNTYSSQLAQWPELALFGVIVAMGLGGCMNSTAGGIKVFRIGLFYKSVKREIRRLAYPESSYIKEFFHHQRDISLDDTMVKTAMILTMCYILLYLSGAIITSFFGYSFIHGEKILKQLPFLDIVCGPNHLASIIDNISGFTGQQIIVRTGESDNPFLEYIPSNNEITIDVPVTKGCNNFCSYCIVPFARGKLKSRKPESILQEIKCAVEKGIKSVTLLGQNVNEYGKDFTNGYDFADLVREIANIDGLLRIGFLTSHPEDTGEKILKTMAECSKVLKHLHIPVQSGSDKILKKMNRKYTVEKFLEVVEMARDMMPEISITSDIIVGFPGETEHDFEKTYELVKKTRFNELFIFKYSPRPMTKAYNMEDDVPKQEKERRHKIILDMQKTISNEILSSFAGKTCQVLAEKISVKNPSQIIGKNIQGISVTFQGDKNILGTIARIKIVNHREGILCGSICEAALSPQDLQCPGKTQK